MKGLALYLMNLILKSLIWLMSGTPVAKPGGNTTSTSVRLSTSILKVVAVLLEAAWMKSRESFLERETSR